MRVKIKAVVLIGMTALGAGCMSEDYRSADGLTDGAGDTIAGNTVMQMVDPWKNGVQNPKLLVPAARGSNDGAAQDAADAKQSQTMSSSSSGN